MLAETKSEKRLTGIAVVENQETEAQIERLRAILVNLQYEGKYRLGKNLKETGETLALLQRHLTQHILREESFLFPFFIKHLPKVEPLVFFLSSEHKKLKSHLQNFKVLLKISSKTANYSNHSLLIEKGIYLTCLLRDHFQEESKILYAVADKELRSDEKRLLAKMLGRDGGDENGRSL